MGPCPFRHGYAIPTGLVAFNILSFNGAMPFQAWICCVYRRGDERRCELQWGHALSGMDICKALSAHGAGAAASMGPCPFRHGYATGGVAAVIEAMRFNGAMPFQAWIWQK